jgi:hypothetical protein
MNEKRCPNCNSDRVDGYNEFTGNCKACFETARNTVLKTFVGINKECCKFFKFSDSELINAGFRKDGSRGWRLES